MWDGDNILWEVQQADSGDVKNPSGSGLTGQTGNIGYVSAGGLDAPLGMIRNGTAIVLHRNWKGLVTFATDDAGDATTCAPDLGTGCDMVSFPGVTWGLIDNTPVVPDPCDHYPYAFQCGGGGVPWGLQGADRGQQVIDLCQVDEQACGRKGVGRGGNWGNLNLVIGSFDPVPQPGAECIADLRVAAVSAFLDASGAEVMGRGLWGALQLGGGRLPVRSSVGWSGKR